MTNKSQSSAENVQGQTVAGRAVTFNAQGQTVAGRAATFTNNHSNNHPLPEAGSQLGDYIS